MLIYFHCRVQQQKYKKINCKHEVLSNENFPIYGTAVLGNLAKINRQASSVN